MCLSSEMHSGPTDQDVDEMHAPVSTSPSITFESLTFSDGTTIGLDRDDMTRRRGETTSSFISASKSVPPARISVLPQVAASKLIAWALLLGLTYSKGRIR